MEFMDTQPINFFLLYSYVFYGAMKFNDEMYFSQCVMWGNCEL